MVNIDVVVISYAGGAMLENCLASLNRYHNDVGMNIIVQCEAKSIPHNVNTGFSRVTSDWWVLFNDDWEPTQSHWLDVLYTYACMNEVGIVCPRIIFHDGRINHCGYLISPYGEVLNLGLGKDSRTTPLDTELVDYAHPVMNNSKVFKELGGYDSSFIGSQFADVDYAYRCGNRYKVMYVDEVVLMHNHRKDDSTKGPRNQGRHHNADMFRRKHKFPIMANGKLRRPNR